jgi:excisionase family DNA binding protein
MKQPNAKTDIEKQPAPVDGFYLTKGEVSARLQCSRRTVELWMQKGLPHYKFGPRKSLFKWSEVESFLAKFRTIRIGKCESAT